MVLPVQEMKQYNLAIIGKHTESIRHSFDELDKMLKFFASDARQLLLHLQQSTKCWAAEWLLMYKTVSPKY
jgi:hypothetical protein